MSFDIYNSSEKMEYKKFAAIASSSADPLLSVDMEEQIDFWNQGAERLFGYTVEEVIGKKFHLIVPEELRDEAKAKREEALTKGYTRFETIRLKKDGSRVPVDLTLTALLDDNGHTIGIAGSVKDLTEKKKIEEDYQNLFEGFRDGITFTDKKNRIILGNKRFREMTGLSSEELRHKPIVDLVHPLDQNRVLRYDGMRLEGGDPPSTYEFRLKGPEGSYIPVEVTASPVYSAGEIIGTQGIIQDITEREELQKKIRETKEHLERILDTLEERICVMDKDMKIISYNDAFSKEMALSSTDILGRTCYEALHDFSREDFERDCQDRCIVLDSFEKGEPVESVHRHERDDGFVYHESRALPLRKGGEETQQVVYIVKDITEKKRIEQALRKYATDLENSNKLKDLFSDIMRHDLLNPLGVIKNVAELLEEDLDEPFDKEFSMIYRNIEKIEELVKSASMFGQIEDQEDLAFQEMDLKDIIEESASTLRPLAKEKGMDIILPSGSYPSYGNPILEEVVTNLLSNAVKYGRSNEDIFLDVIDMDGEWKVMVTDKGEGVPDRHKKSIFERFKRIEKGSVKGSGLGLAIVKKIIDLHGGRVWVEDNPKGGSIFIFTIKKSENNG